MGQSIDIVESINRNREVFETLIENLQRKPSTYSAMPLRDKVTPSAKAMLTVFLLTITSVLSISQSSDIPPNLVEGMDKTPDEADLIGGKNIFFLETSPPGVEGTRLSMRQACSVESAAKMNPGMTIYLLFLSNANFSSATLEIFNILSAYNNIVIGQISIEDYVKDTPLEEWWKLDLIETSYWPIVHASDLLRLVTLWKYGGIYLDLDIIVQKSLEGMKNFVGLEAQGIPILSNAVLGFSATGIGKKVASDCLEDIKENFDGHRWIQQGPLMITRVFSKLCGASSLHTAVESSCQGFTIYPSSTFFPIFGPQSRSLFDEDNSSETMNILKESVTVHFWNDQNKNRHVILGSQSPYAILASKYCPNIYDNAGDFF